jgi:hypothetical protein
LLATLFGLGALPRAKRLAFGVEIPENRWLVSFLVPHCSRFVPSPPSENSSHGRLFQRSRPSK